MHLPKRALKMTKLSRTIHAAFIWILFNGGVRITSTYLNRTIMKNKIIVCSALTASLLAGCVSEKREDHNKQTKHAKLMAEAKVSKDDAQQTALAKVPNGMIGGRIGKGTWQIDLVIRCRHAGYERHNRGEY
jgi:hypothetical protein